MVKDKWSDEHWNAAQLWWIRLPNITKKVLAKTNSWDKVPGKKILDIYIETVISQKETMPNEQQLAIQQFLNKGEDKAIHFALLTENKEIKNLYEKICSTNNRSLWE